MKPLPCERESDVARAARTGFWSDDLRRHADACPACAEAVAVTTALLEDCSQIGATAPPKPSHVWFEARRRARLHLRRRALFWFRALRILALVYLPAMLVWSISPHASAVHDDWKLSFHANFSSLLTGQAEIFALSGVLLAALCVFAGSWYLAREARTPLHRGSSS